MKRVLACGRVHFRELSLSGIFPLASSNPRHCCLTAQAAHLRAFVLKSNILNAPKLDCASNQFSAFADRGGACFFRARSPLASPTDGTACKHFASQGASSSISTERITLLGEHLSQIKSCDIYIRGLTRQSLSQSTPPSSCRPTRADSAFFKTCSAPRSIHIRASQSPRRVILVVTRSSSITTKDFEIYSLFEYFAAELGRVMRPSTNGGPNAPATGSLTPGHVSLSAFRRVYILPFDVLGRCATGEGKPWDLGTQTVFVALWPPCHLLGLFPQHCICDHTTS